PEPRCEPTPLEGVDVLIAPAAGVLVYRKSLGESVKTGAVVAEVVDPLGGPLDAARSEVRAGTDGLLFARMSERLVRPGQKFCKLAGREPLDYRQAGKLLED
ncbi:MAG: succinylglutamate desuccinylase, partial [Candidatus Competibacter sp.]